jgi:Flp pilus assembly protein TadG
MPSKRWKSRGHRDSGAVAVETAVVSLLLITLLFGIVETSFLLKDYLSVSAAARAGARMGASEPRLSPVGNGRTFADDSADQVTNSVSGLAPASLVSLEVWVYRASATTGLPSVSGVVPSGGNCSNNCIKYTWLTGATKLTYLAGSWPSSSQNACQGDATRDSLGVYVKYTHTSPIGFFFKNLTVAESTVMWLEPYTGTGICKP